MPDWGEVLQQIQGTQVENPLDTIRRKYLLILHKCTGRNVIAYYSGFLQNPREGLTAIDDNDKNAFMQAVHNLDKSKGLDLILHTPGGDLAATQSIVHYLYEMFGTDIRAIIPQMAMSAGTMISLACKEIIMGKESNIGPIDPQFGGMSCAGILEEFNKAIKEAEERPASVSIWQPIIAKYHPSFLGDCEKAISWSESMAKEWLSKNMFAENPNKESISEKVVAHLSSHEKTFNHAKHIHRDECKALDLKIIDLEKMETSFDELGDCKDIQDCVLTIHHTYMHTFSNSNGLKIIENHLGNAMILSNRN